MSLCRKSRADVGAPRHARAIGAARAVRATVRQLLPGRDTPYTAVMAVLLVATAVAL